jgi:alpha-1,6-mannosyltransferase
VDSLAAAIDALYRSDMAQLGANARRKAEEQYDWNRILPQVMQRYSGLLAGGARAALEVERICATD